MIAPVVVAVEYVAYRKTVSRRKLCAIGLLLCGIAVATLSDAQVSGNPLGIAIAAVAVLSSALYQVWAGAKQAELGVSGNQLLHQVRPRARDCVRARACVHQCAACVACSLPVPAAAAGARGRVLPVPAAARAPARCCALIAARLAAQVSPIAVALLGVLIPLIEPLGLAGPGGFAAPGTILGFRYSRSSVLWILFSSCLGLLVTLSTYLFIGATSGARACSCVALGTRIQLRGARLPHVPQRAATQSAHHARELKATLRRCHSRVRAALPLLRRARSADVQRGRPPEDRVHRHVWRAVLWRRHHRQKGGRHHSGHGGHCVVHVAGAAAAAAAAAAPRRGAGGAAGVSERERWCADWGGGGRRPHVCLRARRAIHKHWIVCLGGACTETVCIWGRCCQCG